MASADHPSMADLEGFRSYLQVLAAWHLPAELRRKLDASDVVQQSLLQACEAWEEFRGRSEAEIKAWLRRILTNHLADIGRAFGGEKRNVARERSLDAAVEASSAWLEALAGSSVAGQAVRREQYRQLVEALADLPGDQRLAIELHHLQGLSVAEVATQMERTEAAVAGLLRRGLQRLRDVLQKE